MNRPIFLTSFFSMNFAGSKFLISPAIWQLNRAGSKASMREMPLRAASSDCHVSSVVSPIAVIRPTPVTTTLREIRKLSFLVSFRAPALPTDAAPLSGSGQAGPDETRAGGRPHAAAL
jgi:hypothetical protein